MQKWWLYYKEKSTYKRFGSNEPSSELQDGETRVDRTTMKVH